MPTFDFRCASCKTVFEKTVAFGAKTRPKCPSCGKKTEKLLSAPGVVFKGSGFYKTDKEAGKGKETPKKDTPKKG